MKRHDAVASRNISKIGQLAAKTVREPYELSNAKTAPNRANTCMT
jgi:hypothetical protein